MWFSIERLHSFLCILWMAEVDKSETSRSSHTIPHNHNTRDRPTLGKHRMEKILCNTLEQILHINVCELLIPRHSSSFIPVNELSHKPDKETHQLKHSSSTFRSEHSSTYSFLPSTIEPWEARRAATADCSVAN